MPGSCVEKGEIFSARGFTEDETELINLKRRWWVRTDDDSVAEMDVSAYVGVTKYQAHPTVTRAIARKATVSAGEGPRHWYVEVEYSSEPFAARAGAPDVQNPASPSTPSTGQGNSTPAQDRLPVWTIKRKDITEILEEDLDGVKVVNAAGDRFDPPVEVSRSHLVISVQYYSINVTTAHIAFYWDSVNLNAWQGYAARTLKVQEFSAVGEYNTIAPGVIGLVSRCTVELEHNPRTWDIKVLNAGKRAKYYVPESGGGVATVLRPILDDTGQPISEPVPLTAGGEVLALGVAPNYLTFRGYYNRNFATLLV